MDRPQQSEGQEEVYRYEPPRVLEPGQTARRSFEECYEERLRRPGETLKDWLDAIHAAMLEAPNGPKKERIRRREVGQAGVVEDDDDTHFIAAEEVFSEPLEEEDHM